MRIIFIISNSRTDYPTRDQISAYILSEPELTHLAPTVACFDIWFRCEHFSQASSVEPLTHLRTEFQLPLSLRLSRECKLSYFSTSLNDHIWSPWIILVILL